MGLLTQFQRRTAEALGASKPTLQDPEDIGSTAEWMARSTYEDKLAQWESDVHAVSLAFAAIGTFDAGEFMRRVEKAAGEAERCQREGPPQDY